MTFDRIVVRIGMLLIAEGIIFNASALAFSTTYVPGAAELSVVTTFLGVGIAFQVLLSYLDSLE